MAPNAIGPYWVVIRYHSQLAPHTMSIPTRTWTVGAGAGDFEAWDSSIIAATTMITALVDTFLPLFDSGVTFDNYTIMRQLLVTDDPQPVAGGNFTGKVGTDGSATWAGAVEIIMTARTAGFGIAKLQFLDAVSGDSFAPILTPSAELLAVLAEWEDDGNAWAGRDNTQVTTFMKATVNLNQKLRKEYRYD